MFKDYQSKPITRSAYKIAEGDTIHWAADASEVWVVSAEFGTSVLAACFQKPFPGDYIVYLNADDVYHCSAEVFAERNIIPE